HHTGKTVAVAQPQSRHVHSHGRRNPLLGMRSAAQERKIAGGDQFDKIGGWPRRRTVPAAAKRQDVAHGNRPCIYHSGMTWPPYSPWRNSQKRRPAPSSAT